MTREAFIAQYGNYPVLSIRQPWAYLVVNDIKNIENRSWKTKYRGKFFVHASLRYDTYANDYIRDFLGDSHYIPDKSELQFGGIIGLSEILDCITDSDSVWAESDQYHWQLGKPMKTSFYAMKGKLQLFKL